MNSSLGVDPRVQFPRTNGLSRRQCVQVRQQLYDRSIGRARLQPIGPLLEGCAPFSTYNVLPYGYRLMPKLLVPPFPADRRPPMLWPRQAEVAEPGVLASADTRTQDIIKSKRAQPSTTTIGLVVAQRPIDLS